MSANQVTTLAICTHKRGSDSKPGNKLSKELTVLFGKFGPVLPLYQIGRAAQNFRIKNQESVNETIENIINLVDSVL
jgi:hypothetical protein